MKHLATLLFLLTFIIGSRFDSKAQTGGALNFTNGDYVDLGTSLSGLAFGTGDFTLETWFKTSMTNGTILSKRSVCGTSNFWNIRISTGKIRFEMMETAGANTVDLSTPLSYNDNTWHHVAVVRNGTIVKIIMDGYVVVNTNSAALTNLNNVTDPIKIGQSACSNFIGEIDETRIWTVARTACEIYGSKGYQFNSTSSTLKFNAHYNQGTANGSNSTITSLTNSASNAIPATLIGFALTGTTSNWVNSTCPAQGNTSTPITTSTIASCDNYVWAGTTYTASGIYTNTFLVSNSCDSVAQLNLTINPLPNLSVNASSNSICSGQNGSMSVVNATELAYCIPTLTNNSVGNDYINFFSLNTVNSLSGESSTGYTYFNGYTMNANVGTNPIQFNIDNTFSQGLAMWIDFNQDGDFNDVNEYIALGVFSALNLSGNLVIPSTAINGITRLRIACRRGVVPAANQSCGGYDFGEFEDYKINITGGVSNTNITWLPSTFLASAIGETVTINNITSATTYTVTYTDANGCSATGTKTVGVNPLPATPNIVSNKSAVCGSDTVSLRNQPTYCTPTVSGSNISNQHYISFFTLGSSLISNASGEGPGIYNYYQNITGNVTANTLYSVVIGQGGTIGTSKAIWIDLNNDGDFVDANEFILSVPNSTSSYIGSISIPSTCYNGITRMRVAVSAASSITSTQSCSGFTFGEYEDYNLNVSGGVNAFSWSPPTFLNTTTTNNVVANNLNATTTYTLTVTDANGCTRTDVQTITKFNIPNVTINVSNDSICEGSSVTLNGSGASTYIWSNGVTNGVAFVPVETATYTVTGTASTGCTKTATQTVEVLKVPTFPTNSSGNTICPGDNASIDLIPSYCTPTASFGYWLGCSMISFQMNSSYLYHPETGSLYNDFTNEVIEVNAGSSYSFSLNHTNTVYFVSIFIDYNQNGEFENSEVAFDGGPNSSQTTNGTITIPTTALSGKTRIRVAVSLNFIEPCQISHSPDYYDSEGEYDDFTLKISGGTQIYSWSPSTYLNTTVSNSVVANSVLNPITYTVTSTDSNGCTATKNISLALYNKPVVNASASASIVCSGTSITLNATGADQYTWSNGIGNGTPFVIDSTSSYTVIGIDSNGCKDTAIQTVNVYPRSTLSISAPVNCVGSSTNISLFQNYCIPSVTSNLPNRDFIDTFIFNGNAIQSFTSEGPNSYNDYSNISANVNAGNSYNFTMGIGGTVANSRAIWIDYNQDGDFSDLGEFVWSSTATLNTLNGSVTIPLTASNGKTRMRVLCTSSIGGALSNMSCNGVVFGEFEDYNLQISGGINRFVWSPSSLLVETIGATVQTTTLNSNTTYNISFIDQNGCNYQDTFTALVNPLPKQFITSSSNSICPGSTVLLTANDGAKSLSTLSSTINFNSNTTPVSATCNISGLPTSTSYIKRVYVNGLTSSSLYAMSIILQSPNGQSHEIINYAGIGYYTNNANIIFEDNQPLIPVNSSTPNMQLNGGTYRTTVLGYSAGDPLSSFTGNLNGTWSIFVVGSTFGNTTVGSIQSIQIEFGDLAVPPTQSVQWSSTPSAQIGIANPTSLNTNVIVNSSTTYTLTAIGTNGCTSQSTIDMIANLPSASFSSIFGNTLCVDNANTTFKLDTSSYCIPAHANGGDQSNYYLTSFYLPDGVTTPWFISSNQENYSHYNHVHQLTAGNSYTCTLGYTYPNSRIHAWIDYNQDGDFYDAGEYLGNSFGANGNTTIAIPIQVPSAARNGYARLRVAATSSDVNDPCGGSSIFGEYEDYDLIISGGVNNPNIVWSPATNLNSTNGYAVNASNIMSPTTYTVTVTDDGGCTNTSTQSITINPCGNATQANVKLFLQGYYTGSNLMTTALSNQGQLSNSNITDTIQVEFRDPINTSVIAATSKTLLNKNGNATATFSAIPKGYYYIVVKHRNGIETWSTNPVLITNTTSYNFSNAANKAYGNNQIEVENGVWAIYSGDINQDNNIDLLDASFLEADINNFEFGYFNTDLNGDGNVDLVDGPILENNVSNFIYSIHP